MAKIIGLQQLALVLVSEEELFLGVARSLYVPITFPVVQKMLAQGCPVSVTFACRKRRLTWAQDLLRDLHFDGDERGNGSGDSLDS